MGLTLKECVLVYNEFSKRPKRVQKIRNFLTIGRSTAIFWFGRRKQSWLKKVTKIDEKGEAASHGNKVRNCFCCGNLLSFWPIHHVSFM